MIVVCAALIVLVVGSTRWVLETTERRIKEALRGER